MSAIPDVETTHEPEVQGAVPGHVLVVDDSAAQRRIVTAFLKRWGYSVTQASSGQEALDVLQAQSVDLVISDWMMPGMDGLELCKQFRAMPDLPYTYFILLTSKSDKVDIARGLDVGADDFVSKPVSSHELKARIRAGERILEMERALRDSNSQVTEAFSKISALYEALDRDLQEARNLQESLVREKHRDFGAGQVSLMLRSSGHVGGDLVGFFPINDDQVGLYAIDVSGHGVASALLTVRLASHFPDNQDHNIALAKGPDGGTVMRAPSDAAAQLNNVFLRDIKSDKYFTMNLACITLSTGLVRMAQCGHPDPFVQEADGSVQHRGLAGFPVGLLPGASWQNQEFTLKPGARMLFLSDGVTECTDPQGVALDDAGAARLIGQNSGKSGTAFLDGLIADLEGFAGGTDFADDVSALMFEYQGPPGG